MALQLDVNTVAELRRLLAAHDASQEADTASKDADAEPDWGLGGILHLILDHIHVREDLREQAHTAVDALAEATGEVADTVPGAESISSSYDRSKPADRAAEIAELQKELADLQALDAPATPAVQA